MGSSPINVASPQKAPVFRPGLFATAVVAFIDRRTALNTSRRPGPFAEALEAAYVTMLLRELEGEDWEALRDLRLYALETELGRFFRSPSEEREKSEDEWRALAAGDDVHQLFGLFDGDALVGITAIVADADDPSGATASLGMSYVKPAYRGRGFGARYYEARLAWARARPQFTRAVVGHRRSNAASRHLIERFGFRWTEDLPHRWPDGSEEDDVCYELPLH